MTYLCWCAVNNLLTHSLTHAGAIDSVQTCGQTDFLNAVGVINRNRCCPISLRFRHQLLSFFRQLKIKNDMNIQSRGICGCFLRCPALLLARRWHCIWRCRTVAHCRLHQEPELSPSSCWQTYRRTHDTSVDIPGTTNSITILYYQVAAMVLARREQHPLHQESSCQ